MTIGGIGASDLAALSGVPIAFWAVMKIYLNLREITCQRIDTAKQTRALRERMTAMPDQPFHWRLLTESEQALTSADGQTSEQWMRAVVADFIAHRRSSMPTCGDYLAEFDTRTKARPARPRTLAGNRLAGISGQRK